MTRGHVRSAQSSSPVASSDGHDTSRLMESESTTWTLSGRRIFIRGARRAPIFPLTWERRGKLWIVDRSLHLSLIRRLGGFAEELHDRGPIEPRSRRDRAAIVARSSRDRGSSIVESRPRCTPHDSKECGFLFEAKFQRSCFLFEAKLKAIVARSLCLLEAKLERICRGFEATKQLKGSAPTMPSNRSHDRINQPQFLG